MRFRGGYDVMPAGRPAGRVEVLPEPDSLYLPLRSRRFEFSELCAEDGQRVQASHVLARDQENYSVPLLAPREGTVSGSSDPALISVAIIFIALVLSSSTASNFVFSKTIPPCSCCGFMLKVIRNLVPRFRSRSS